MYTVHLANNSTWTYGQLKNGAYARDTYGFDHKDVVTAKKFLTKQEAQRQMSMLYLDELQLGHDVLEYREEPTLWEICYILPVVIDGQVQDHVKYYLQNTGSLVPEADSHNSMKFCTYSEAHNHVTNLGILLSCFSITKTTEDF